jgi:hypothetical protein
MPQTPTLLREYSRNQETRAIASTGRPRPRGDLSSTSPPGPLSAHRLSRRCGDRWARAPADRAPLRDVPSFDDALVMVRGGPMTVEELVEHAQREQHRYGYRGVPMPSISVDATVDGWNGERILRDRVWSRSSYATTTIGLYEPTAPGSEPRGCQYPVSVIRSGRAEPLPAEEVRDGRGATSTDRWHRLPVDLPPRGTRPVTHNRGRHRRRACRRPRSEWAKTIVELEVLSGDPLDYAEALSRAHIAAAGGVG